MQKLLISLSCIASFLISGCSSTAEEDSVSERSWLERIPIVYRQDIQQGNIVTQEMVNRLQPGMSKRQVRFLLGTPMLLDVFHQNRWDYHYTMTEGWGDTQTQRLVLFFDNEQLVRTEGDLRPMPVAIDKLETRETVVSVPDYDDSGEGILSRTMGAVGDIWDDDQPQPKPVEPEPAAAPPAETETSSEQPSAPSEDDQVDEQAPQETLETDDDMAGTELLDQLRKERGPD